MDRTILVVDSSCITRELLRGILCDSYDILEAADGQEALDIMHEGEGGISALLMNLVIPGKNGFQVLDEMFEDKGLRAIPVVIFTAEKDADVRVAALDAGASSCLVMPLESEGVRLSVRNAIDHHELEGVRARSRIYEELRHRSDYDDLTGIFSRGAFCRDTHKMLVANQDVDYLLVRWDIERFKLVNELFGTAVGDQMLKNIAMSLRRRVSGIGTYARLGGDNFVMCIPEGSIGLERLMQEITDDIKESFEHAGIVLNVAIVTGVYRVSEHDLDVGKMCDRAAMALSTVKGNYNCHLALYDDALRKKLLDEQDIVGDMDHALEAEEFEVYLQPIYSLSTNRIAGAEALCRWNRPGKGLVLPGDFIPLFEFNGFISKLDAYMVEKSCQIQADRIRRGVAMIPISINLSRKSVYDPHVVENIVSIARRYGVNPKYLRIEITESAYMDDAARLIATVKRLRRNGFLVLMDDFGSGYSSFNALKDIPVDLLKIDTRFMEGFEKGGRVGTILAAIVHMAKWLGISVIAEGVETAQQYELLQSIGCECVQGFFCARPMVCHDFMARYDGPLGSMSYDDRLASHFSSADDVNSVLGGSRFFDRMMSDIFDAYAICDLNDDTLEIIRVSRGFFRLFDYDAEVFNRKSMEMLPYVLEEDCPRLLEACRKTVETGGSRNLLVHCTSGCVKGTISAHVTVSRVNEQAAASALLFVALLVVDGGDALGIMSSCPRMTENT